MPYFYKKSYVIDEIYDGPIAKSSLGPSTKKYDLAGNRGAHSGDTVYLNVACFANDNNNKERA